MLGRKLLEEMLGPQGARWMRIVERQCLDRGCWHGECELPADWSYSRRIKAIMKGGHLIAIVPLEPATS